MYYCREDTVAGKVYIKYPSGMHVDTNEQVLYDYNWRVGDTVRTFTSGIGATVSWVYQMDSTQINGICYKVWHFTGDARYNVIEGLGCTNGLNYPMFPYPPFEDSRQLICFRDQYGSYPLSNPVSSWGMLGDLYFDNFFSCNPSVLGIDKTSSQDVSISPNPITHDTKITFSKLISSGTLTISNILGQHIVDCSFTNRSEFPIGDLINLKGIYIYRITDNQSGNIFLGKFQY